MKEFKPKELVFNHYQVIHLIYFLCGVGGVIFDVYVLKRGGEFSILCIPLAIIFLLLILISPLYYVFEEDKLSIIHTCGLKEIISYNDIKTILERYTLFRIGCPAYKYYGIHYPHEEKFLLNSEICKSKRVKRLLEYYTNKEIE